MIDFDGTMQWLLDSTDDFIADLEHRAGDDASRPVGARLRASVIRPQQMAAAAHEQVPPTDQVALPPSSAPVGPVGPGSAAQINGRLWELAHAATELRCQRLDVPGLGEAAAALQDLALGLADEASRTSRIAQLAALQSELTQQIEAVPDGPYLVTNLGNLYDYLGVPIPTRPVMALCRCGESGIKPTCDGACHRVGFTTAKDPARVADRRGSYVGQSVTVLDNRGTCQHSGLCTDRLASVFHLGQDPFVTPSGGRLDEIVRAVRDCPSGALSYAMDTVEAREQVDYAGQREPAIEVSKDGPYRITGGIALLDGAGSDVARTAGASREHYALCRCGHSQNKPFCSGMHWYVDFADPVPDAERTPSIFEWCGGLPALTRMTRLFYEKYVPADPMLGPVFANMSADHPQRVAKWLGEVFGGPSCYSDEYGGYPRMISQHVGKCRTEEWRARWVTLMIQSSQGAGLPNDPEFRSAFSSYLEWGSRLAVENSQTTSRPPQHMPMPSWNWATAAGPPGSRISALAPVEEEDDAPVVLPAADEPVRFAKHIKPLFRARDRQSMTFVFDLWSYDDVRAHAEAILTRLSNGSMPCDARVAGGAGRHLPAVDGQRSHRMTGPGPAEPNRRPVRSWWGGNADRGDSVRLEAFSDGVLAIAITLLILDVRVGQQPGQSLAAALAHAGPEVGAYAASFLQIGIMWANHHALFRIVDRVDQLLLLANLGLLLFVAFLPLPTRLVAEHTSGDDARTAMLLYGATLTGCALAFNLIWRHAVRRGLLAERVDPRFRRDVDIRYLAGLGGYLAATLLALIQPWLTLTATALLALLFLLGPSPRPASPD